MCLQNDVVEVLSVLQMGATTRNIHESSVCKSMRECDNLLSAILTLQSNGTSV